MKNIDKNEIVVYQAKNGSIELRRDLQKDTVWANLQQIADLFETDKSGISRHIKNIYKIRELEKKATVAKIATVQHEGNRQIKREIEFYNLDIILSVGYRVNSKKATIFRQWATKTLRQHITKGYTINPKVIKNNYSEFQKAIEGIKHLLPNSENIANDNVVELISAFADTWLSLEAYDKDKMIDKGATKKSVGLTSNQLNSALFTLKKSLIQKGEATDLFGAERQKNSVEGIIGNVMQTFGGKQLYPTVEDKAAHLLYFMVKNHPYVDGNKRSGAYAFVWFLQKAGILKKSQINPPALTALTLFIAESNSKNKDRMVKLVLQLLRAK
ncbi:MAG: virulence protein RhuM/Fic/DOC family protein [bacterium]|nr:virulence protein RhuM/Fic/DOC family protein [bacterium]